jgi:hypothetical protein
METKAQYVARRRRELAAERWRSEAADLVRRGVGALDNSKWAKDVAGTVADAVGVPVGVGRGMIHDVEAIGDGARLAVDLVNTKSKRHEAAVGAVKGVAHNTVNYARTRGAQPSLLLGDANRWGARMSHDLNPAATPMADTFGDEIRRRFDIGRNQGETAYHVASVVAPAGAELKSAIELGRFAKAGPAKYVEEGVPQRVAERFAQKDDGMGHHSFFKNTPMALSDYHLVKDIANTFGISKEKRKEILGKIVLRAPRFIVDSPFNVVRPNVESGLVYKRHAGLDEHYGGGKVGKGYGGERWTAADFGWTPYSPLKRLWYGTPGATKGVVLGVPGGLGLFGHLDPEDETPQ